MTDPTIPDAVTMLQRLHARAVYCANHGDVPRISSAEVLAVLRAAQAEREQLGILTELYDVTQARLEAFEEREPDARKCAEWAATVALKSSDVHSAARRYLCGECAGEDEGDEEG